MTAPSRPVVVHVMGWESQQYGSFERQLVLLGERLDAAGAELHLVFRRPPPSREFTADVGAALHVLPAARGPADLRYVARCAGLLRGLGATHLHAHHGTDAYLAVAAARLAGVPHRYATKHITPGRSRLTASRLRHRALAGQVETVFAVSRQVADSLVTLGVAPDAVTVHHMGVDATTYRPDAGRRAATRRALGLAPDTRVVLSTSHLRPGKGVERMPDVAAALADDPGTCTTIVAGDGVLTTMVAARARELGLTRDVFRLVGTFDDVGGLLDAADVFVLPTDATEGLPASVLEALASGTPAVVTGVPGLEALVGDVARVVPRRRTDALVAAIRAVLAAPDAAARTAAAARALVLERFGVERGVDQLVRAYHLQPDRSGVGGAAMTSTIPSTGRPRPRDVRQLHRLLKGRALDTAMRMPAALQPRRLHRRMQWSVRIGRVRTPWDAQLATAGSQITLTRRDVTDVHAAFVADPFLVRHDGRWLLFVEVQDRLTMRGCIGLASSTDLDRWRWEGVVLREPFHLSYPCVFANGDALYMIPESAEAGAVRLYRAAGAPTRWDHVADLLEGPALVDATPLLHDDHWYLFVETSRTAAHDELRLFHAPRLRGPWDEHAASPIVHGDAALARPAGRPIVIDRRIFRLAQDCTTDYGVGVVAREIVRLTPTAFTERDATLTLLMGGGGGWRRNGMHHLAAQQLPGGDWLVATDGW